MLKFLTLVYLVFQFCCYTLAQNFSIDLDKKKTDREVYNEGKPEYANVLLIPYLPVMHLPDPSGDVELVQASSKGLKEIQSQVRTSLDMSLGHKIKTLYKIIPLLRVQTDQAQRDLDRIYASVSYRYEKTKNTIPREEPEKNKMPGDTKIQDGQLLTEEIKKQEEFMNVIPGDAGLLPYLSNKYESDLFVFVNQVEIRKSFALTSDVAYSNYHREVKVHYTIINKDGKQLFGDVSVFMLSKKTDNINEIIDLAFPAISEDLFSHLPDSDIPKAEKKLEEENRKKAEKSNILKPAKY